MTREEKAISFFEDMNECTYGNLEAVKMAIKSLKAMNQIYKITGGYVEALYQSETAFDGVACVLEDYLKVLDRNNQIADAGKPITEDNSCLATIHTEGLDEEIRCVMCSNRMKSDRGCDGSCVVDNAMYKKVMDAIERRIQPTTRNDKVDCDNADCNNCVNHKYCDYESNNSEIPTGSTTKNNLGVDCIDRKKLIDWINIWDITPIIKNPLMRHIQGMPSVTPQERKADFKELKRKIFMELDGGTDDKWIRYGDACDRISDSIDEYIANMGEVKNE